MTIETTLKDRILDLRSQGLSYNAIVEILNCSKGTIAYHCNETSKLKSTALRKESRKENPLKKKIGDFMYKRYVPAKTQTEFKTPDHQRIAKTNPLRGKIKNYMRVVGYNKGNKVMEPVTFSPKDLLELRGTICYLTGDQIDIMNSKSYHLDHRVSKSKGGLNTLENCELATRAANQAKGDLSTDEFFELCVKVVKHNNLKTD